MKTPQPGCLKSKFMTALVREMRISDQLCEVSLLRSSGSFSFGVGRCIRWNSSPPRTSYVEHKVMEFLESIAEGMPTRCAAAITQIPFETVRNCQERFGIPVHFYYVNYVIF